jgi:sec-independent protein translocase protein TatA
MFGSIGMGELLVILAIVILIFGVNKIPQLGKGLGEGIRNFKSALKAGEEDENAKVAEKNEEKKEKEEKH